MNNDIMGGGMPEMAPAPKKARRKRRKKAAAAAAPKPAGRKKGGRKKGAAKKAGAMGTNGDGHAAGEKLAWWRPRWSAGAGSTRW